MEGKQGSHVPWDAVFIDWYAEDLDRCFHRVRMEEGSYGGDRNLEASQYWHLLKKLGSLDFAFFFFF